MKFSHENLELDEQIGKIKIGSIIQMKNDRKKRGEVISINGNEISVKDCYGHNHQCELEEIELSEQPIFKVGDLIKDKKTGKFGKIVEIDLAEKGVKIISNDNNEEIFVNFWDVELTSDILFDELIKQGQRAASLSKSNEASKILRKREQKIAA